MKDRSREWTDLAVSAAGLTDTRFLQIVELFERIRHEPGVCSAMGLLRPRLAELRPPRRISVSRLFFLPVEDLLDDTPRYQRKLSRISRGTIPACWQIICAAVGENRVQRLAALLADMDAADVHGIVRLGESFWLEGAAALNKALDEAYDNPRSRVRLFGRDDDVLRQVAVITAIAQIGPTVQLAKAELPDRPIEALADYHIEVLRTAIRGLAAQEMRQLTPFLLVLSARMLRPGDLLAVLADIRLEGQQQAKDEVAREIGSVALENLLRQSGDMPAAVKQGMAAGDVATLAERLLDGFDSLKTTLQQPDHRRTVHRVEQARSVISAALQERVIGPADTELLGHVEGFLQMAGNRFSLKLPSLPTPQETAKAEDFARAWRRCFRIAPMVGLKSQMQEKTTELCRSMRQVSANLAAAVAPDEGGPRINASEADEQMVSLMRLVELIAGPDEAEALLADWEGRLTVPSTASTQGWEFGR
jgi:hypothetical protein